MTFYIFKLTRKLHQKYFSLSRTILWFIIRRSKHIREFELRIHFKVQCFFFLSPSKLFIHSKWFFLHFLCVCVLFKVGIPLISVNYQIFTSFCLLFINLNSDYRLKIYDPNTFALLNVQRWRRIQYYNSD